MKKEFNYIENYKGIKIYQYDDNKDYAATVGTKSFEKKDLKDLKTKIDEVKNKNLNDDVIKYIILD